MLAAARAMLKVRTLTDLNGAKADAVDAGSGAARDPPDTVLVDSETRRRAPQRAADRALCGYRGFLAENPLELCWP